MLVAPDEWVWFCRTPLVGEPRLYIVGSFGLVYLLARAGSRILAAGLIAGSAMGCIAGFALVGGGGELTRWLLVMAGAALTTVAAIQWWVSCRCPRVAWLLVIVQILVLAYLWVDGFYFRLTKGHVSLLHLWFMATIPEQIVQAVRIPASLMQQMVGEALVFAALLLVTPWSLRRDDRPLVAWRAIGAMAVLSVVVVGLLWVRLPAAAWPDRFASYLNLRMHLLTPVPPIAPFTTAAVRQVAVSAAPLDLARAHRQGSFRDVWPAGVPRRNLVVLWCESLRADVFSSCMPQMAALASHNVYLRQHLASTNFTVTSMVALRYGFVPIEPTTLFAARQPTEWYRFLRDRGYRLKRYEAFRDWVTEPSLQDMTLVTHELDADGYGTTEKVLEQIADELQASGPCVVEGYLFNTHWDYYFPHDIAPFQPVLAREQADMYKVLTQEPTPEVILGLRNRYRNAVHYLDMLLGRFFARMAAAGRLDDTVFVILGDHGESLGENGFVSHSTGPMPEQFRTPCLIVAPGEPARAVETPTDNTDILPTLQRLLGYEVAGLAGIDVLTATRTATVLLDTSTMGRVLVREGPTMSIFTVSGGYLRWQITTTADYALDARPDGLYSLARNEELAALVRRDMHTAGRALRQDWP